MSYKISVIVPAYNVELFLPETLDSLVNQTFKHFEVIIINDGSTDNTQNIIEKYCKKYSNFRYILQENTGVAAAKNKGIDESKGDYITFLDGDDKFTTFALEKLYDYANKTGAELVVGQTKIFNLFYSKSIKSTKHLSKNENILPFNLTLIWSFSQSNKLFLREKIEELNIRIQNKKYAEDGIFVLDFAHHCNKIVGCPHLVLYYRKRLFYEGYSATQSISSDMLIDYLESYHQIIELSKENFKNLCCNKNTIGEYHDSLIKYYQYIEKIRFKESSLLLEQFYRNFWRMDNDTTKKLKKELLKLKKVLFPDSWNSLTKTYCDLNINNIIQTKKEMAKKPIISICISKNIDSKKINNFLKQIYHQDFPAFELLINQKFENLISSDLKQENLHFIKEVENQYFKKIALDKSKGDAIIFFDDSYILAPDMFREMYKFLEKSELDFVSTKLMSIRIPKAKRNAKKLENKILKYPSQEKVYSDKYLQKKSNIFLDLYFSNKMIKTKYLKDTFKFTADSAHDVKVLYENASSKKIPGNFIFSQKREKHLIKLSYSQKKSIYLKTRYLYFKLKVSHLPSMIKNRIKNSRN